jgi:hypothetical protein
MDEGELMDSQSENSDKVLKSVERVTIDECLKDKLDRFRDQANQALNGIAQVTKSDVVNLIIELHDPLLSELELQSLKAKHFDEVRFAKWMAERLKAARAAGESLSLGDLLKQGEEILNSSVRSSSKVRKSKRRNAATEVTEQNLPKEDKDEN